MKNRGIWIVIAGIIASGILITTGNSIFLKKQQNETSVMVYDAPVPETTAAAPEDSGEAPVTARMEAAPETESTPNQETEAPSVMISPLETAAAVPEAAAGSAAEAPMGPGPREAYEEYAIVEAQAVDYRSRLNELDLQIQRIRSEETESTTYSMNTAAENELKLWDSELNTIYNDILNYLDEEQKRQLVTEEREWMRERDAKAVEAAKKSAGGTLEGLQYTASLAESTRARAYELADFYEQVSK